MRPTNHSFMLNFVLLMLLVGPVACLPTKPEADDDKQEVDVTDSGERAEVHNRELSLAVQTNVGQDSRNEIYSHLRETVEAGEVNADERYKGASNIVGKTTGGSVSRRMIEDRMLTAPKNELDASERSEWSGWAMTEAPAMFDIRDKKEKHNRNRRRKSTSGNFGPGSGKKSDIVHSTSFGKEVSEDNKTDKGRTLMLLDREAEASGAKKTVVETLLQYIGIPISLAIVLAACAWTSRCYECLQRYAHGVDGENEPLLINAEQHPIAGSGENMAEVSINITPPGEDVRPPVPPDKSIGKVTTKKSKDEDDPYKIAQVLARYTDHKLYEITESYQEQLESAIHDVVEHIIESLNSKWRMSEMNLEEITTLIRKNQRTDASQHILDSVLGGDIGNSRLFWNALSKTEVNPQYLMTFLTQGVEIDVNRLHRYNLRRQNRKLKLPKPRLISDIYTEPTIIVMKHKHTHITGETNTTIRKVEYHELFKRSNRVPDQSTICVVHGAAGTGKTTLIQKLIYDWSMGMIYEEFSFVIHLKIKKLNEIKDPTTFSKLIVDAYPYLENYLEYLWNEPKKFLFIFDDLDQLYVPLTLDDTGRNSDPRYRCAFTESEHFVCNIIRSLLQGEFLRGCSVLITTRVWKLELLHHVAADSTVQVMGFTSEKAKEYFRRYLGNGKNTNEIVEFIEQNDILWNMCNDPLFCVTLASSAESCQAQGEGQTAIPIVSHTQVLCDYVAQLLAECGYDANTNRKCLSVFGELADKGIRENTLSFEGNELRDLDSCPPNFISAFLYQDPDKQSGGVIYEFRHSVLRDFLAALTNVLNTPISRLKGIDDKTFPDITRRFSTFSIFLVGLSSRKSIDRLELKLHAFPIEVTYCISEWLRKSVSRRLKDMDKKHTQRMFLWVLYSLFEFGDNDVMMKVLNPITTIKLNRLHLKSPDCIVLSRTLISPEVIQELDLSSCIAQPEDIRKLEQVLPRCVILRLNQNNLQDSGVIRLFDVLKKSKIKTLALKSNRLTDNCLESAFFALTTNPSLMQLNLSNSSQDEKQANQFSDEKLQYHYERSSQQKEIKWLRMKHFGRSVTELNSLTLITD